MLCWSADCKRLAGAWQPPTDPVSFPTGLHAYEGCWTMTIARACRPPTWEHPDDCQAAGGRLGTAELGGIPFPSEPVKGHPRRVRRIP